jgi:hypothetical protein
MAKRKKSISLLPHERKVLEDVYVRFKIPRDQYEARPTDLAKLTEEFNGLTGRVECSGELIRYIRNRQKNKDWPTFDGSHLIAPLLPPITAEEEGLLIQIYKANVTDVFANCTDALTHNPELASLIATEFATAAGRVVPAYILVTKLTALRKRGLIDKIDPATGAEDEDMGFGDIGKATGT